MIKLPDLYIYTDHKKNEIIFSTTANSITEADKLCKAETGIDVIKHSYIGCQKLNDQQQKELLVKLKKA
jgi:hypothetical protein